MQKPPRFVVLAALLLAACQEAEGPCPVLEQVSPETAGALDEIAVSGRRFALAYDDLFGDAAAVPPTAYLTVNPNPLFEAIAPGMSSMDLQLEAELVVYRSSTELVVTMPDLAWADLSAGLALYGVEIDPALLPPTIPLGTTLHVRNPLGCEGAWAGELTFTLVVDSGAGG